MTFISKLNVRINMRNARYYLLEIMLSPYLHYKKLKVNTYITIILPVKLGLILREEQRFRVFENKVLKMIFGAKRGESTREWTMLHNVERHALYS